MDDWIKAQKLLDAAGVEEGPVHVRILWVANRWLGIAGHHTAGCQCQQCIASRKIISEAHRLEVVESAESAESIELAAE